MNNTKSNNKDLQLILSNSQRLPSSANYHEAFYCFRITDKEYIGTTYDDQKSRNVSVKVRISTELIADWELNEEDIYKVLFQKAIDFITENIEDDSLKQSNEIVMLTTNSPDVCPYIIEKIPKGRDFQKDIHIEGEPIFNNSHEVEVGSQIVTTRDEINAIFKQKYKTKLLALLNERDLIQLFKPATETDLFRIRLFGLSNLISEIVYQPLLVHIGSSKLNEEEKKQSITVFRVFLEHNYPKEKDVDEIVNVFRNIKKLRNGYPAHKDSKELLDAHKYFNLEYPIRNSNEAWNSLLSYYSTALDKLLNILKK